MKTTTAHDPDLSISPTSYSYFSAYSRNSLSASLKPFLIALTGFLGKSSSLII
jgi:hypothetical protein